MKKEVFLAILIGVVMGLFITYGIYLSQRSRDQAQIITTTQELEAEAPAPDPEINGKLAIFNPEDEIIIEEDTVQVTGKSNPNAFIVIFVNNDPLILQADATGNFSKEVNLNDMANVVRIHAVDETGEHHTAQRTVVVYTEELALQLEAEESDEVENDTSLNTNEEE